MGYNKVSLRNEGDSYRLKLSTAGVGAMKGNFYNPIKSKIHPGTALGTETWTFPNRCPRGRSIHD